MPKPEIVSSIIQLLRKSGANYRYVFDKLDSPDWIAPLAQEGMFKTPPGGQEVEGGISFPDWPASRYLARMAKLPEAQSIVVEIAIGMAETQNPRVHGDLIDIALAVPPAEAARLVKKVKSCVQTPFKGIAQYKFGELMAHLADGGRVKEALQVAEYCLALFAGGPQEEPESDDSWKPAPEPSAWLDDWHYEHALKEALPALVRAGGLRTLAFLCRLLDTSIVLSRRPGEEGPKDYSYIWHEWIESDEHPSKISSTLISAVRNAAEKLVEINAKEFGKVLETLRLHRWTTFKRLELHLMRRFPEVAMEDIESAAPDLAKLGDPGIQHEAALLLSETFPKLKPSIQEQVLHTIEEGPEEARVLRWFQFVGVEPTPEAIAGFKQNWRAERFALLEQSLPETWKGRVQDLLSRVGTIRRLASYRRHTTWVGPTSPKSSEQLSHMDPDQIFRFLQDWQPKGERTDSTPEGLGRILEGVVGNNVAEFARRADIFRGLDPTYVRFLFSGLREGGRKGQRFDWPPVLSLARWVTEQPREIPARKKELMDADPDWGWTRSAIADLLELGLQSGDVEFDCEHREVVWAVLEPLTSDPDPTPEHEAAYGGNNMNPATMSINTVRGRAFHALISYALWVRRCLERQGARDQQISFESMPEARKVLDEHLNPAREPSLTVRSVYGRYFPLLQLIDREWVQGATLRIFPLTTPDAKFFQAAWESYLVFCQGYKDVLPLLLQQYRKAMSELNREPPSMSHPHNPRHSLAHHIVAYYSMGEIEIADDSLLNDFFHQAPDEIRGEAIGALGRALADEHGEVSGPVLERLRELWTWRLETAQRSGSTDSFRCELSSFGWWFVSRKFDDEWALDQLLAVLMLTGLVEPEFTTLKTLTGLSSEFPLKCVRCLSLIVENDSKGWLVLGQSEDITTILKVALASSALDAKADARQLIDRLVAQGHFGYRSILPQ